MEKIKVGIIGAGSISELHFEAYKQNKNVEIAAVCDLNEQRAKDKADMYGASQYFTDYHDLLALDEVDAVSICTWNNSHAEISIAALNAGKHVLVEKPLCKTVKEALEMAEVAKSHPEQVMQVGFVRRHGTNAKVLKKFIDAGDMGELYYAKASYIRAIGNPGAGLRIKSVQVADH
ncbi:Inositol 2-dehydrogenase [Lentibacillus sp. JNUCC-1]|nr:Inositol 2-dehydrogenase [Lentibacillus sp. JNUCC-1]